VTLFHLAPVWFKRGLNCYSFLSRAESALQILFLKAKALAALEIIALLFETPRNMDAITMARPYPAFL